MSDRLRINASRKYIWLDSRSFKPREAAKRGRYDVGNRKRIIALEETIAHQAKTIEEEVRPLTEQWKVVEQTRAKLDRLTESGS